MELSEIIEIFLNNRCFNRGGIGTVPGDSKKVFGRVFGKVLELNSSFVQIAIGD